ncbi:hypothetical protein PVK06_007289 [Gossypium arboreum]|uniref:Uncharacterized protein n=1 Tax=Gossypium arboreum TaxID=29729 RepID=A0ABR0QH32_GOSAR|nr:hypothetical protein PVK06_007289 [Gossypium arboreum]
MLKDLGGDFRMIHLVISASMIQRMFYIFFVTALLLRMFGLKLIQVNGLIHEGGANWVCLFGLLSWRIWKNRNLYIFNCKPWSSKEMVQGSYSWALQFFFTSQVDASFGTETTSEAHLSEERVYLNTDGAVHLDSGFAAAGGVVRDK